MRVLHCAVCYLGANQRALGQVGRLETGCRPRAHCPELIASRAGLHGVNGLAPLAVYKRRSRLYRIIRSSHKRTEGRAPVWGSEFTTLFLVVINGERNPAFGELSAQMRGTGVEQTRRKDASTEQPKKTGDAAGFW